MPLPSIVVINRTPRTRRALVECGVGFQPGQNPNLPLRLRGAVRSFLAPLGAWWPDGSPRWARLVAVMDLPPGVHRIPLEERGNTDPDPPFAFSPWVMAMGSSIRPALVVGATAVEVNWLDGGLFQLQDVNHVRQIWRCRERVPGTPLLWTFQIELVADLDWIPFECRLEHSEVGSSALRWDVPPVLLETTGAFPWLRHGTTWDAKTVLRQDPDRDRWSVSLWTPDYLADGQGFPQVAGFLACNGAGFIPTDREQERLSSLVSESQAEVEAVADNWAEPELFGPGGGVAPMPPFMSITTMGQWIDRQAQAHDAQMRTRGYWLARRWESMPWTVPMRSTQTGLHPTHGAHRLAETVLTANPAMMPAVLFSLRGEPRRPCHHLRVDGSPVVANTIRGPWWSERPNMRAGADGLGKPREIGESEAHNQWGLDDEHATLTIQAAAALLTGRQWILDELSEHHAEGLKMFGVRTHQPRALGWLWLDLAWLWWLTGRQDVLDHLVASLDHVVGVWRSGYGAGPGPVRPVDVFPPHPGNLNRRFWMPWQVAIWAVGAWFAHRITGHQGILDMLDAACRTCDLYGWDPARPVGAQVGKAIGWKVGGEPLTDAEYRQVGLDGWVVWGDQTDWRQWQRGQVEISRLRSRAVGDPIWQARADSLSAALEASRRAPSDGGPDQQFSWLGAVAPHLILP